MASKPKGTPTPPISDVAVYGDIDTTNDYPPGTFFQMPDGTSVDMNAVGDYIGGKVQPPQAPDPNAPPAPQNPPAQ